MTFVANCRDFFFPVPFPPSPFGFRRFKQEGSGTRNEHEAEAPNGSKIEALRGSNRGSEGPCLPPNFLCGPQFLTKKSSSQEQGGAKCSKSQIAKR